MARPLRILALEPWHAGSHKDFLEGLTAHSRHHILPYTLPGRFWKWRQTGSGMVLAERVLRDAPSCDLIFASDFLNLPDFLALTRRRYGDTPAVLYFHENQLTYPLQEGHNLDLAYAQANLSGAAAADAVWFNSTYHQEAFLEGLDELLAACPDFAPTHLKNAIRDRSRVLPLGVDLDALTPYFGPRPEGPLTVLWNHRWEHDKNPEGFFHALFALADRGADFRVIVLGQSFRAVPSVFGEARRRLADRILHWGFVPARDAYARLLSRADVVVSTARHDFFGVSVVEAMHAGCMPLLSGRLNYPHLVPETAHETCLLKADEDLEARLAALCARPQAARAMDPRPWALPYAWHTLAPRFDRAFEEIQVTPRATDPQGRDM